MEMTATHTIKSWPVLQIGDKGDAGANLGLKKLKVTFLLTQKNIQSSVGVLQADYCLWR